MSAKMAYVDGLTWQDLQSTLRKADESTCKKMIEYELKNQRRLQFMLRMHGRYNRLRITRERAEIANGTFK